MQKHSNITHVIKTGQKLAQNILANLPGFAGIPSLLAYLKSVTSFTRFHPHLVLCVCEATVFSVCL